MAHTPGPWLFREMKDGNYRIFDRYGFIVAEVFRSGLIPFGPDNTDNVYLLSAAPDLLAACKAFDDPECGDSGYVVELARAAVAKAEGREG